MKAAKPTTIPEVVAAGYTSLDQFERFDAAVSKVLSVPRADFLRQARSGVQTKIGGEPQPARAEAETSIGVYYLMPCN